MSVATRLSEELSGSVLQPGTAAYNEARISFNGMIDRRPALIAQCFSVDDVALAVSCGVELDLPISIRGGGHSCDNLVRAEVVTATGERVVAGEDGDPELLWALRGGGGNFGVVTEFEFALHERGPMLGGYISFSLDDMPDVLTYLAGLAREMPDELVVMPWIAWSDDDGQMLCNVGIAYAGEPEVGRREVAELRALLHPVRDEIGRMSYLEVQAMNGRDP